MSFDNNLLYTADEVPKDSSKRNTRLAVLIVGLFCSLVLAVWFYAQNIQENPQDSEALRAEQEAIELGQTLVGLYNKEALLGVREGENVDYGLSAGAGDIQPTGGLVFSASRLAQGASDFIQTFILDISKQSEGYRVLFPEHQLSAMSEFLDPSDLNQVFLLATSSYTVDADPDQTSIHFYDRDKQIYFPYESAIGLNERNLSWSATNSLVAFNRMKESGDTYVDLLPTQNWELVIFNAVDDIVISVIDGGSNPVWSPDGMSVIYLKSDGLYTATVFGENEQKLLGVAEGAEVTTMSMLSLSPDGTKLLWTAPKAGVITYFEITSWKEGAVALNEVARIKQDNTEFYWPVFSPDGLFYVVQAIDTLKEGEIERQNPRFEIRNIAHREPIVSYPLKDLNFDEFFTDAWVKL